MSESTDAGAVHDEAVVVVIGVKLQPEAREDEYVEQLEIVPELTGAHDTQ